QLREGREGHPLTPAGGVGHERDAHAADRAGEGQTGDLGGGGGAVDADHVVGVVRSGGHDGQHDLDLVAQPLHEGGAQRAVGEAGGEDRVGAGAALAAEGGAGEAARGEHALPVVDRRREEVEVLLRLVRDRGRREPHGVVVEVDGHGAGGLLGGAAGLEADLATAVGAVVDDGGGGGDVRAFHGHGTLLG